MLIFLALVSGLYAQTMFPVGDYWSLDSLRVKSREDGKSCNKSVYVALGINFECQKKEVSD
jgi:hypothetical protein